MAGEIEKMKAAGFSDEEVNSWAAEEREKYTTAGFTPNEIDAYFTGGVVAPAEVPKPMLERLYLGDLVKNATDILKAGKDGFGPEPLGLSDEHTQQAIDYGIYRNPVTGKGGSLLLETALHSSAVVGDLVVRSIKAGVHMIGEHVSQSEFRGGAEKQRLKNETINFLNWRMQRGDMELGRFTSDPGGGVRHERVGAKPTSEDFTTSAAEVTGNGTAPLPVQEKLLKTYNEAGLHPAEVAQDAKADPVIAQKMMSKDPLDVPFEYPEGGYGGYQFNVEEPVLPPPIEEFRAKMAEMGVEASQADLYYKDIQQRKVGVADEINTKQPEHPPEELPKLFGDFKIEPELVKELEQPMPREGTLASAEEEVSSRISVGKQPAKEKLTLEKLYTEAIDDIHPIKRVNEEAYELARLTRGQAGRVEHWLEHGTVDFHTGETTGPSLRARLAPVADDLDGLRRYMSSKHAMDLEDAGLKTGVDYLAARQVVTETGGKFEAVAQQVVEYNREVLRYLKDSGVLSEEAFAAMIKERPNYVPFYRVMGEAMEGGPKTSGGFGPGNPVKALKGSTREIIDPLESIIKNTYAYLNVAERNAVGIKLVEGLKKNGAKVEIEGAAGKANPELIDYLKGEGITNPDAVAEFISRGTAEDGTTIGAWRDGKRETVKIDDPALVKAFNGLDRESSGFIIDMLALPAKGLRAGSTLTPEFMGRNVIRDFLTAFVNTGKGIFSPIDTIKGFVGVVRKDVDFQNWLKHGGANATLVSLDRLYMQESLSSLAGKTGLFDRVYNAVAHPVATVTRPLRLVSELMENATRLGEFKKLAAGQTSKEALQKAAFGSREVTLDFARVGAKMRSYNMIVAFGNAQIQGVDRVVRAFLDRPLNTTLKVAGSITAPSALLWWANHGDPRYEELPAWQKDLFWIIPTDKWEAADALDAGKMPGHLRREVGGEGSGKWEVNNGSIYRIPKPFELGVIFGSGMERILSATIGKDKEAFAGFTKSVWDIVTPNILPTAAAPLIDQYANRSSFTDRTLIPAALEKQLPEYQYTPYTTQLSRKLGTVIAAFPGMQKASIQEGNPFGPVARGLTTPILIENYVRGWTGGLGTYIMQAADAGLRKGGVLPDPIMPASTLADIPFVKAFVVRYPSASAQSIQDFFDEHKVAERYYATWKAQAKEGNTEAMERIRESGGPMMFARLDAYKKALTEHTKVIRDITNNPEIPAAEKRQLIDGSYYAMIQMAQRGRELQRQIKKPTE